MAHKPESTPDVAAQALAALLRDILASGRKPLDQPDISDEVAVHDLRTRVSGPTAFIQLHLEMDGAMPLLHAYEIADAVEGRLRAAYPNAEIIIHQDPAGLEEAHTAFPPRVTAS